MFKESGFLRKNPEQVRMRGMVVSTERFLDGFPYVQLQNLMKDELRKSQGDIKKAEKVTRSRFAVGDLEEMNKQNAAGCHDDGLCLVRPDRTDAVELNDIVVHEALHLVADNRRHARDRDLTHNATLNFLTFGPLLVSVPLVLINIQAGMWAALAGMTVGVGTEAAQVVREKRDKNHNEKQGRGFRGKLGSALADEGMTVLIASEMTPKLLRRTGLSALASNYESRHGHFFLTNPRPTWNGAYPLGQVLMTALINTIAKASGLSVYDVYDSFKKQYFTNGFDEEVKVLFEQVLGSEVMEKMAKLSHKASKEEVYATINEYFDRRITVNGLTWTIQTDK